MDANTDAYAAFLLSQPPDRVLPCLRQDLVRLDEWWRPAAVAYLRQSILFLECFGDHRPGSGPRGRASL